MGETEQTKESEVQGNAVKFLARIHEIQVRCWIAGQKNEKFLNRASVSSTFAVSLPLKSHSLHP